MERWAKEDMKLWFSYSMVAIKIQFRYVLSNKFITAPKWRIITVGVLRRFSEKNISLFQNNVIAVRFCVLCCRADNKTVVSKS